MTAPRLRPAELPGWPRWLTEELAAAYVGVSLDIFRMEIGRGIWPKAARRGRKGGRNTWDRDLLDRASDQLSNPARAAKERMLRRAQGKAEDDAHSGDPVPA